MFTAFLSLAELEMYSERYPTLGLETTDCLAERTRLLGALRFFQQRQSLFLESSAHVMCESKNHKEFHRTVDYLEALRHSIGVLLSEPAGSGRLNSEKRKNQWAVLSAHGVYLEDTDR